METLYKKKGQVSASIGGVIFLMVGLGVASLVQIFVGVLGGKTYQLTQNDIAEITGLTTIRNQTFTLDNTTLFSTGYRDLNTGTVKFFNATGSPSQSEILAGNFTVDLPNGGFRYLLTNAPAFNVSGQLIGVNYTAGSNEVKQSIQDGISASFEANAQTGSMLPVVALAFMVILILSLLVSVFTGGGGFGGGDRGSAL